MSKSRTACLLFVLAAFASLGLNTNSNATTATGRFVVKFNSNQKLQSQIIALNSAQITGLNVVDTLPQLNAAVVTLADATKGTRSLQSLAQNPAVEYVEEDQVYSILDSELIPDDARYAEQTQLMRTEIQKAWAITQGSDDVVVAVSDTGVSLNHEDLKDHLWTNTKEVEGDGIDNDKNGYKDDLHGWNFHSSNNNPDDDMRITLNDGRIITGHGSHVAGIIGAASNNKQGIAGINWKVKILAAKGIGKDGSGMTTNLAQTIVYAADNGARVINCSWGGSGTAKILEDAIKHATQKGALLVAAAGNDNSDNEKKPTYPASYELPGMLTIASSVDNAKLSSFSNWGEFGVDIAAPGSKILSTVLDNKYELMSGTSMATPMVTGIAALVLSVRKDLDLIGLRNALLNATLPRPEYISKTATDSDISAFLAVDQLSKGFQIFPRAYRMKTGSSFQFTAFDPNGSVTWGVSDPALATIDQNGKLSAKKAGRVVVSATDASGKVVKTENIQLGSGAMR